MKERGVTLIALIVTIVVLLILAGVSLAMLRGENGIISKAQKSARETRLAKTKESISLEISDAMINEAIKGNKTLTDEQLKDIVNKYGEMDEDGDTIHTDDGDLSLKDLINGTTKENNSNSGTNPGEESKDIEKMKETIKKLEEQISSLNTDKKNLEDKVENLQNTINSLQSQLEESNNEKRQLEEELNNLKQQITEKDERITELERQIENQNEKITNLESQITELQSQLEQKNNELSEKNQLIQTLNNTVNSLNDQIIKLNEQIIDLNKQIIELSKMQSIGNAVEEQVLEGKMFSNSSNVGLIGKMPNRGLLNWSPTTESKTYTVPEGYYSGGLLDASDIYNTGYDTGNVNGKLKLKLHSSGSASRASGDSKYMYTVPESTGLFILAVNRTSTQLSASNISLSFASGTNGTISGTLVDTNFYTMQYEKWYLRVYPYTTTGGTLVVNRGSNYYAGYWLGVFY